MISGVLPGCWDFGLILLYFEYFGVLCRSSAVLLGNSGVLGFGLDCFALGGFVGTLGYARFISCWALGLLGFGCFRFLMR